MSYTPSTYRRYIEHLDSDATTVLAVLCDLHAAPQNNSVTSASFTLLRRGGCGQGTISLSATFDSSGIEVGHFIRMSYAPGQAWYLGRVEEVTHNYPSGVTLNLFGPMSLLNDVPIGGAGPWDVTAPRLIAASDWFKHDVDRAVQDWTVVGTYTALIGQLYNDYIGPVGIGLGTIESPVNEVDYSSMVFRSDTSVAELLKHAATTSYNASYGVNANNEFFFLQENYTVQREFTRTVDVIGLTRTTDRSMMYNRIGVYGGIISSARMGPFQQTWPMRYYMTRQRDDMVMQWGAKDIVLYLPYIRNDADAYAWMDRFLDKYAGPRTRYTWSTLADSSPLVPWAGAVRLLDENSNEIVLDLFDEVTCTFGGAPVWQVTTGVEDIQYPVWQDNTGGGEGGGGGQGRDDEPFWSYDYPLPSVSDSSGSDSSGGGGGGGGDGPCGPCGTTINIGTQTYGGRLIPTFLQWTDPFGGPVHIGGFDPDEGKWIAPAYIIDCPSDSE